MGDVGQNNVSTPQQTPVDPKVIQDIKLGRPVDFTFMSLRTLSSEFKIYDGDQ